MQDSQKKVVCALLRHIYDLGLISKYTCSRAEDLVHSMADVPAFFQYPIGLAEEEPGCECT